MKLAAGFIFMELFAVAFRVTVSTQSPELNMLDPSFLQIQRGVSFFRGDNICCGDLGCFNSGGHFHDLIKRPLYVTPNCDLERKLTLHLNTRANPNPLQTQILRNSTITESNFNSNRKTILIIHGYQDYFQWGWWQNIVNELLYEGDYNVIRLDWSAGNKIPYAQAVANLRLVGAFAANFLLHLRDNHGLNPDNLHLVGHSLGAHGSGYIGSIMKNKNAIVGRITGLDPAGPYFTDTSPEVRLDPTDAKFVDTIVTDGESILDLAFGSPQAMGHINFFPNGGKRQPGCESRGFLYRLKHGLTENATSFDLLENVGALGLEAYACSHARSTALFAESINKRSCQMKAFECTDYQSFLRGECFKCRGNQCNTLGYNVDKSLAEEDNTKKYYTITAEKSPFCVNPYKITFTIQQKNGNNDSKTKRGSVYVTLIGTLATSEKRLLTEEETNLKPGLTYTYFLETCKELGEIRSVVFYWDYEENILRPSDYIRTQYIWLEGDIVVTEANDLVSTFTPSKSKVKENTDLLATLTRSSKE